MTLAVLAQFLGTFVFDIPMAQAATGIYKPISYQGKVTTTGGVAVTNGSYNMRFKIFAASSGGSPLWTETWDNSTQRVTMTGGLFSVLLGTQVAMTGSVDFNSDSLYLQVEYDPANAGTYPEVFAPRRRFASVPYAQNADRLDGLDSTQFVRSDVAQVASGTLTIRPRDATKVALSLVSNSGTASTGALRISTQGANHIVFGSGGTNYDTNLYRSAVASLRTDATFIVTGTMSGAALTVQGGASYLRGTVAIGRSTINANQKLEVLGAISGSSLYIANAISGSGGLNVRGTIAFRTLTGCSGIATDSNGTLSCAAASTFTQTSADARYVNVAGDTMTGALVVQNGNTSIKTSAALLNVRGTMSGRSLVVTGSGSNMLFHVDSTTNRVSIGTSTGSDLVNIFQGRLGIARDGVTVPGNQLTYGLSVTNYNYSGTYGEVAMGVDSNGNSLIQSFGGKPLIINGVGNNVAVASALTVGGTAAPKGSKLEVLGTMSGSSLYISRAISGSGGLNVRGTIAFRTLTGCSSIATDANGTLSCAAAGSTFGSGNVLTLGDARYVRTAGGTMTGALVINVTGGNQSTLGLNVINTISGAIVHAQSQLRSSGTLVVENNAYIGTSNGVALFADTTLKRVGVGTDSPTAILDVTTSTNFLGFKVTKGNGGANVAEFWKGTTNILTVGAAGITATGDTTTSGNFSGATMTIQGGVSSILGTLAIGRTTLNANQKLEVLGAMSGSSLYIARTISGSGGIVARGTISFRSLTGCTALQTDSNGTLSCGAGGSFGTGNVLTIGDSRYVRTAGGTMTGALNIRLTTGFVGLNVSQLISGASLFVKGNASVTGSILANGSIKTRGVLSGATLYTNGISTLNGAVTINMGTAGGGLKIQTSASTVLMTIGETILSSNFNMAFTNRAINVTDQSDLSNSPLYLNSNGAGGVSINRPSASAQRAALDVAGTISGSALAIQGGASYFRGTAVIGRSTITANQQLEVLGAMSGSSLYIARAISGSGGLNVRGTIAFRTLTGCTAIQTDANGTLSCGSGSAFGTGNVLTIGDSRYIRKAGGTMTGALTISLTTGFVGLNVSQLISGSSLFIKNNVSVTGSILANGTIKTRGILSGATLAVQGGASSLLGTFVIGRSTINANQKLEVVGSISGSSLYIANAISGSGGLNVRGTIAFRTLTGCSGLQTDANGTLSCAAFTQTSADARYVRTAGGTMTGALNIRLSTGFVGLNVSQLISGSSLFIKNNASITGTLLAVGNITTHATLSGAGLVVNGQGTVKMTSATLSGMTIFGMAGQTAGFMDFRNSNNISKLRVDSAGFIGGSTGVTVVSKSGIGASGGDFTFQIKRDGTNNQGNGAILRLTDNTSNAYIKFFTNTSTQNAADLEFWAQNGLTMSMPYNGGTYLYNPTTNATDVSILQAPSQTLSAGGSHPIDATFKFNPITLSATSGVTSTEATQLFINGAMIQGTNVTIVRSYAALLRTGGGRGIGLGIRAGVAQSGALMQFQGSGGRIISAFTASGSLALSGSLVKRGLVMEAYGTISGSSLYIANAISGSGGLNVRGTVAFRTLTGCSGLQTDSNGTLSCGSGGGSFGTGNVITIGDARYVRTAGGTMTGALNIRLTTGFVGLNVSQLISGSSLFIKNNISVTGAILANGNITTRGTLSGSVITQNGAGAVNIMKGTLAIGPTTPSGETLLVSSAAQAYISVRSVGNTAPSVYLTNTVGNWDILTQANTGDFSLDKANGTNPFTILNTNENIGLGHGNTAPGAQVSISGSTVIGNNIGAHTARTQLEVVGTISGALINQNGAGTNFLLGNTVFGRSTINANQKLEVLGSMSGSSLYIARTLSSSGGIVARGTITFRTLTGCSAIQSDSNGTLSCGSALTQAAGDARYVQKSGDTMTGALNIRLTTGFVGLNVSQLISGSSLFIKNNASITGTVLAVGNITTRGTLSGAALTIQGGASSLRGTVVIGRSTITANQQLEVLGAISGSALYISRAISGSGGLNVRGTIAFRTLTGCTSIQTDANGTLSCGSGGGSFGTGNVLTIGDARYIRKSGGTMTGALTIQYGNTAAMSGGALLRVRGAMSGRTLTLTSSGTRTPALTINKTGTGFAMLLSGSVIQQNAYGTPKVLSGTNLGTDVLAVAVQGQYAYLGLTSVSGNDFVTEDVTNPNAPHTVGGIDFSTDVLSVAVQGHYAYVGLTSATGNDFRIVDIADPANPRVVGGFDPASSVTQIYLQGNFAFIGTSGTPFMRILDISNPRAPVLVSSCAVGGGSAGLTVRGTTAYTISNTFGGVKTHTITNLAAPVCNTGNAATGVAGVDLAVVGNYVYKLTYDSGNITVQFNVSTIGGTSMSTVTYQGATSNTAYSMKVSGRYAYITFDQDSVSYVKIIDISNPASAYEVGSLQTPTTARSIFITGKYAYIGMASATGNDFRIIDLAGANFPTANIGNLNVGDLSVDQNVRVMQNIMIGDGLQVGRGGILSQGSLSIISSSTGSSVNALDVRSASGSSLFVVTSSGSVGIGTATPKTKLEVRGAISGASLVISRNANITGALLAVGNITTRGTLSGSTMTLQGGASSLLGSLVIGRTTLNSNQKLEVLGSMSGSNLYIARTISGSGGIVARGTISFRSVTGCSSLQTDANGTLSCGSGGGSFGTGNVLTIGDARYVRTAGGTMTGALNIRLTTGFVGLNVSQLISGSSLYIKNNASITGALLTVGNITTRGTLSGAALTIQGGASSLRGTVVIGRSTITANQQLEVLGSMSGSNLYIARTISGSGGIVARGTIAFRTLTGCSAIQTDSNGTLSCGSALTQASGDARYVNTAGDTMTGTLVIQNGNTHSATTTPLLNVRGTMSGRSLYITGTGGTALVMTNITTGRVGIGTSTPKATLDVVGTISGSALTISGLPAGRIPFTTTNGAMTSNTNLQWDAVNSNVVITGAGGGIPGFKVYNGSSGWYFYNGAGGAANFSMFDISANKDRFVVMADGSIQFGNQYNSPFMYMDATGQFGIGKNANAIKAKLDVVGTISGSALNVSDAITGSGGIVVRGTVTFRTLTGCTAIQTDSNGTLSCGSGGTGITQASGDARYVNTAGDTMTGALTIQYGNSATMTGGALLNVRGTMSGSGLAVNGAMSGSKLVVLGNTVLGRNSVDTIIANAGFASPLYPFTSGAYDLGTSGLGAKKWRNLYMSGAINITNTAGGTFFTANNATGRVGIGLGSPKTTLEVVGTISGSALNVSDAITGSGGIVVRGTVTFRTLTGCTSLQTDSNGTMSCGSGGGSFGSGNVLTIGDNRYIRKAGGTMTGALVIQNGNSSTFTSTPLLNVRGTMSGRSLFISGTGSSPLLVSSIGKGIVAVGSATPGSTAPIAGVYPFEVDTVGGYVGLSGEASVFERAGSACAGCAAEIDFLRARNSIASRQAAVNGDTMGSFFFRAYNGSAYGVASGFGGGVDNASLGGNLTFSTNAALDLGGSTTERMRIDSSGNIGVNTNGATAKARLEVVGSISGTSLVVSGVAGNIFVLDGNSVVYDATNNKFNVRGTISGSALNVSNAITGSGGIVVRGTVTFRTLTGCTSLQTDSNGTMSCGSGGGSFGTGNVLTIGDNRYIRKSGGTMTGMLTIQYGNTGVASGVLLRVRGAMSGRTLTLTSSGTRVPALTINKTGSGFAMLLSGSVIRQNAYGTPKMLSGMLLGAAAVKAVVADRGYAFVGRASAAGNEFQVIDVTNPLTPRIIGGLDLGADVNSVSIQGRYAYLGLSAANGGRTMLVVDIAVPASPTIIGGYASADAMTKVVVSGKYAYVAAGTSPKFRILDISNPRSVTLLGSCAAAKGVGDLAVRGSIAFLGMGSASAEADVTVSDPMNPTNCPAGGGITLPGTDRIVVSGNYSFRTSADNTGPVMTLFIRRLDTAVDTSFNIPQTSATTTNALALMGHYLMVGYSDSSAATDLSILDITNPILPRVVGTYSITTGTAVTGIAIDGKYAYITSDNTTGLNFRIMDLAGIEAPSATIGVISAMTILTQGDVKVGQSLSVGDGLQVGRGGILSQGSVSIISNSSGSSVNALDVRSASGSAIFVVTSSGSVGIGNATPKTKLEVSGTISGASLVISGTASITGALLVKGNIRTRGTFSGSTMTLQGGASSVLGTIVIGRTTINNNVKLEVLGAMSGSSLFVSSTLSSSGGLVSRGTISFRSLTNCPVLQSDANGTLSCGSAGGTGVTLGTGDQRYIRKIGGTMTGALTIQNGNTNTYTSTPMFTVRGTMSGRSLFISGSGVNLAGNPILSTQVGSGVGIGVANARARLEVRGLISGASLKVSNLDKCGALYSGTGGQILCGGMVVKTKTTSTASPTTNVALQESPEMTFKVAANDQWVFQYNLRVNSANATPGFEAAISAPAGSTCRYNVADIDAAEIGSGSTTCYRKIGTSLAANRMTFVSVTGNITVGGTAGTGAMRWGQYISNANAVNLLSGSTLVAFKPVGSDLAEVYNTTDTSVMPGALVSIDPENPMTVRRTHSAYDPNMVGVISSKPGMMIGGEDLINVPGTPVFVALVGRVPVMVSDENGPIAPGDYLTASSQPGIAMKATRQGTVVGQAMTAFTGPGMGVVTVFVQSGDRHRVQASGTEKIASGSVFDIRSNRGLTLLHVMDSGSVIIGRGAAGTATGQLVIFTGADFHNPALAINSAETNSGQNLLTINSAATASGVTAFRVTAGGDVYAAGQFNSPGADYAEWFPMDPHDTIALGDAVCLDPTHENQVKRCDREADPNLIGIRSTKPSVVGNAIRGIAINGMGLPLPGYTLVGLIGQLDSTATAEGSGGAIKAGDSLTSSAIPGMLRRALPGEPTVGVALTGVDSGQKSIRVLIARSNKSLTVEAVEEHVRQSVAALNVDDTIKASLEKTLSENGFNATLTKKINDQISDLKITDVRASIVDLQNKLAALSGSMLHGAGGTAVTGDSLTLTGSLAANDLTSENTLTVGRDARIGGDLYLEGALKVGSLIIPGGANIQGSVTTGVLTAASGSQIAGTLTVQGDLLLNHSLTLGSGAVLRANQLLVSGALLVQGPITIAGLATFLADVTIHGELKVSTRQAGFARIGTGESIVIVHFDPPFTSTPVVTVTPQGRVGSEWWTDAATQTGFVIHTDKPVDKNVTFSFLALTTDAPHTASGTLAPLANQIAFPLDEHGVPVSSSDVWNACIRNQQPMDPLTNTPFSCARYRTDTYTWTHPDFPNLSFVWNDSMTPPLLVLPEGYVSQMIVVPSSSSSSSSSSIDTGTGSSSSSEMSSDSSSSSSISSDSSSSSSDDGGWHSVSSSSSSESSTSSESSSQGGGSSSSL